MTTRIYIAEREAMWQPDGVPIGVIAEEGVELRGTHVSILGPSEVVFSFEGILSPEGRRVKVWVETEGAVRITP